MLTGYPSESTLVSTASSNLLSHLAASAHTAHLTEREFFGRAGEIPGRPEQCSPWRHIDEDAHVVRPPQPLAEPRAPQGTRGLTRHDGFQGCSEVGVRQHVG